MTSTVEVQQRRLRSSRLAVTLSLSITDSLNRRVKAIDVGLVVLRVVQLHDLTRDVRLERAIVVCTSSASVGKGGLEELTGKVGESGLAADKSRAGHAGDGLYCGGAETGAQGGSCAEKSGRHDDRDAVANALISRVHYD